jgi:branched-chain amino acid transport system ATP-binding protein
MTTKRLEIKNVCVKFGGLFALRDVSFEIDDNQLLGFIGPNGAGKTTLMRVIMGMITPLNGGVFLDGRNITGLSSVQRIHAGVALAQQIVKPLRQMSLLDNVALASGGEKLLSPLRALTVRKRSKEREVAQELLIQVGLGDHAHKLPSELPLGHLKRLEVARSLALNPLLLLLDEPLAGLSKPEAEEMADLIASLPRIGLSVILIEHNLPQVQRVCQTLYVQSNGCKLAFGATNKVLADPEVRRAYLGVDA